MGRCPTCGQNLCSSSSPPHPVITAHNSFFKTFILRKLFFFYVHEQLKGISGGIQRSLMRVSQERFVKPAVPPQATPPHNPASPAASFGSNPRSSSGTSSPMDTGRL